LVFYFKEAWAALTGFSIGLWDVSAVAHLFSLDKAYVGSRKYQYKKIILWDWVWIKYYPQVRSKYGKSNLHPLIITLQFQIRFYDERFARLPFVETENILGLLEFIEDNSILGFC
jgi:hypothetical protein